MARSNEISMAVMSSTEEDIKKLYDASKMGSIQIFKMLLQNDPNLIQKVSLISTSNVESPLHVSVSHGHLEFTRLLLDHSPELAGEVDAFQRTPLHLAVTNGCLEMVQALLEKNTSTCLVRDQEGFIPLHYAVIDELIDIIHELINARPQSIWMKLGNGQTILHLCAECNHLEGMKLLTETVVNRDKDFLNTIDDAGNTVLDLSLMLRQSEMVGYLLLIPEVKIGTSIANFTDRKGRVGLKKQMSRNYIREKEETEKTTRHLKFWGKKVKCTDWVEEVQGTMMLVATVIATVTFQAGLNPPGGFWQEDTPYNSSKYINQHYRFKNEKFYEAGAPIMSYRNDNMYAVYSMANLTSFIASVTVITLIISRFPLVDRFSSWMMVMSMFVAVFFLAFGYVVGVKMVNSHILSSNVTYGCMLFMAYSILSGIFFLVHLWHMIGYLLKSLCHNVSSRLKSHSFYHTIYSRK